jgi:hypothetical protein
MAVVLQQIHLSHRGILVAISSLEKSSVVDRVQERKEEM